MKYRTSWGVSKIEKIYSKPLLKYFIIFVVLIIYLVMFDLCTVNWVLTRFQSETDINHYEGYFVTDDSICERISLPLSAEEFLNNYQKPCKPVIIHVDGGFKSLGWNTDQWNAQYLSQKVGHLLVDLEKKVPDQRFGWKAERTRMPFSEFLSHTFNNGSALYQYYLNLQPVDRNRILLPPLSFLSGDFDVPSFFLSGPLFAVNLWIGSSDSVTGTKSGLHHDDGDNLYILLKGKKKVRLFSPQDSFNVYPIGSILDISPGGHHTLCGPRNSHWSQIDLDMTKEEIRQEYPRYFDTKSLECVFEEGEMLFIPNGWWHEVTSYGVHVAINVWTEYLE